MDLNRVRLFVEVVDRGSFTAAAAALGLPKSSVSRGVAALEEDLGVTLLRRTTRQLTLTDSGKAYVERARLALQELLEAGDAASDAGDEPRGLVRLTAPVDLSGGLAEVIAGFLGEHPQIRIDLILTARTVDLVAEGVDLALRAGRLQDSTLIARRIADGALGLFASPAYLSRRGHPRKVDDLRRHACIVYRGGARWSLQGPRGATASVDVAGPLSCDELSFVVYGAEQALGIGLLPYSAVAAAVHAGRLVAVLPGWTTSGGGLWLVHPPMRHLPRRVALLRDALIAGMKSRIERCPTLAA
ncbi:MAG: LysR family transcriptional regulator [Kofleriaceae bacterium]|nr:LysR family transcriptional regulator [Myxococcales bacterium]MCB9563754.1 LysR family transcriptional regulator [Kofleriaceae bacterium]